MSAQNQKNSIKTVMTLMGVASASIFLSIPALALVNFNTKGGTAAPTNQGGTTAPTNQGGTTTPTNQSNP
jgi:hypothetical protein